MSAKEAVEIKNHSTVKAVVPQRGWPEGPEVGKIEYGIQSLPHGAKEKMGYGSGLRTNTYLMNRNDHSFAFKGQGDGQNIVSLPAQ